MIKNIPFRIIMNGMDKNQLSDSFQIVHNE